MHRYPACSPMKAYYKMQSPKIQRTPHFINLEESTHQYPDGTSTRPFFGINDLYIHNINVDPTICDIIKCNYSSTAADPGFPIGRALTRLGGGGADLRCGHFSVETFAKMKELGPIGGGTCQWCPPLGSPTALFTI